MAVRLFFIARIEANVVVADLFMFCSIALTKFSQLHWLVIDFCNTWKNNNGVSVLEADWSVATMVPYTGMEGPVTMTLKLSSIDLRKVSLGKVR